MKAKRLDENLVVLNETDDALEWFPELELFFKHLSVQQMKIHFENTKETFMIYKE